MTSYQNRYNEWVASDALSLNLKQELLSISQHNSEKEDRFYQYLSFGTGGMRGLLGAGTNRINTFTIRRVAKGLALYIESAGQEAKQRGVAIAYDTRHYSKEFALETAKVLGKQGIRSYVFEESRPTPELSFAVRYYQAFAGVVITASHNPKEYNGFKVYGADGGQLTPIAVNEIIQHMNDMSSVLSLEITEEEELVNAGLLTYVLDEVDKAYQENLLALKETNHIEENFKIVYTPLHGSGLVPVVDGLYSFGCQQIFTVEEQAVQDSNFPTVSSPNPEEQEAFHLAIELGIKKDADLLLATDPDADRLGVAVKTTSGYQLLTGNQLGALLMHYLLSEKYKKGTLPSNGLVMKTIVTSEFGRAVAAKFGIPTEDTLTGFKYISEKIEVYNASGEYTFLFGYEESYGYLIGDFVRDKDAVQAALLTAEMAAFYKSQGSSLYEELLQLYKELGYYKESLKSITLKGIEGNDKIAEIMSDFKGNPPLSVGGIQVTVVEDYLIGIAQTATGQVLKLSLPKENVIKYKLEDDSWICVRPSGTEPKCKFYFGVCKSSEAEAKEVLELLEKEITERVV